MNAVIIVVLSFISISLSAQPPLPIKPSTIDPENRMFADTNLKVIYVDTTFHNASNYRNTPLIFLNGSLIPMSFFRALNPQHIEQIEVKKERVGIDDNSSGKILTTTKACYTPVPISLNALKKKYTNLKSKPTIFIIDGNIINDDYDNYLVDENNLLRIYIDKMQNAKENIDIDVIKVLTKDEENIKKINQIYIRGNDFTLTNK